ncbi:MAG: hypothetical protein ACREIQ_05350 [Nitrospiria bacterium]
MARFWDRLLSGFRRVVKAPEVPPRRNPWVLVAHVSPDPGLQCHFCGREGARGEEGKDRFGLVQGRHNPRLQHVVCEDCLKWNRITSA